MLQRVDLTTAQSRELCAALDNEGDGRIDTENTVNLATLVGFLGTRFLPLPVIQGHGTLAGEERSSNIMLARTRDAFVVLHQQSREYGARVSGPQTVEAFVVLQSTLPFALENRQTGWPLRVRSTLLDIVQWTLDQGKKPGVCATDKHLAKPAWRALLDPKAMEPNILKPDVDNLRAVLSGQATVSGLWGAWSLDEPAATTDFAECASMRRLVENIIPPRTSPSP